MTTTSQRFALMVEAARACLRTMPAEAFGSAAEHYLLTVDPPLLTNPTNRGAPIGWLRCAQSVESDFTLDPAAVAVHLTAAQADGWAHDGMAHLAAVLLHKGHPLPEDLRRFACRVLSGQTPKPKAKPGEKRTTRELPSGKRYAVWATINQLRQKFKGVSETLLHDVVAEAWKLDRDADQTAGAVKKDWQRADKEIRPKKRSQ
jgi:hypothetical protein